MTRTVARDPLPRSVLAEQTMAMPSLRRRWTPRDVRALMSESRAWPRYELIGGELLVTPSAGVPHQIAVTELLLRLGPYVSTECLGIALASPADLELTPDEITQPDVFVVPLEPAAQPEWSPTWADVTRLLLAVEVFSPSSARNDRVLKRDHYMEAGVPEYWIVDLDARIIERWTPAAATPEVFRDSITWEPVGASAALTIDLAPFFGTIWTTFRRLQPQRTSP